MSLICTFVQKSRSQNQAVNKKKNKKKNVFTAFAVGFTDCNRPIHPLPNPDLLKVKIMIYIGSNLPLCCFYHFLLDYCFLGYDMP